MSAPRPAAEVLPVLTERLRLRLFTEDDYDGLYSVQSRPDLVRFVPYDAKTPEQVRAGVVERMDVPTMSADGHVLRLVAELRESAAFVGEMTLFLVSVEHRQGELGFILHSDHHGRGLGAEAANAVLRLGFEWLGVHRMAGQCDARNTASAALMRRVGMRQEAHLVQNEMFKGEWSDLQIFAMLASEWAEVARGRPGER